MHRLQNHPGNQRKANGLLSTLLTIGRFAPSPTGPLHFGSLVAAIASYLTVRQAGGEWLLRIEDIDKPREQPGATGSIIQTLQTFGFEWDRQIIYQSQRVDAYHEALAALKPHTYPCTCSRKDIQQHGHMGEYGMVYPGTCRNKTAIVPTQQSSIRLRTHNAPICFTDRIRGEYCQQLETELGDFVILRADGFFAYQLAVVIDDEWQGVNQVVRGADLLDNTPRQIYLQQLLGFAQPVYAHVPLVLNDKGQKLSKQNLAPAITPANRIRTLLAALKFLGQTGPDADDFSHVTEFWDWAIKNWDTAKIPRIHAQPFNENGIQI